MSGINVSEIVELMKTIYEEKLPFIEFLGIKMERLSIDEAVVKVDMKDEFVGNYAKRILHGGVIATVLDFTGGVIAQINVIKEMLNESKEALAERLVRTSTIDIRVDYIRPGKGTCFYSTGDIIRLGKTVAVTRTEFKNEEGMLIAAATGTYYVG